MIRFSRFPFFVCVMGVITWQLGCTSSSPQTFSIEETLWQLEEIIPTDGTEVSIAQFPASTLIFKDGDVSGQTACNFFGSSYTVAGSNLSIGEIEMTAAACIDEQLNEQENSLMMGFGTVQTFAIEGDRLTLTTAGEKLIFRAQPNNQGSEVAVYTALLREWRGEKPGFVIINDTAFNAPGISLDDTLEIVQNQLVSMSQGSGMELDPATLADFRAKNETPHPLEGVFPSNYPVSFITNEYLTSLFSGGETSGWELFGIQYPDAIGILTLSRVGFNAVGDKALVHMAWMTEADRGNYYHLFTHTNGFWLNSLGFRLEIPQ
jgi:heat shock protein HslJ